MYLKGWFTVDLIAIVPIDHFVTMFEDKKHSHFNQTNLLLRKPKIQRAFKVVRMLKLVKLLKLMKNKEKLQKNFRNGAKMRLGYERLGLLAGMIMYIIHLAGCFWLIIGS